MCNCEATTHPGIDCSSIRCHCHQDEPTLERDLSSLLNKYSLENESGTPDFIMAQYMLSCLTAFHEAVAARSEWRGESLELPALQRLLTAEDGSTIERIDHAD